MEHSSIQQWSKGPLFPAVIAVVESYTEALTHAEWTDTDNDGMGYAEYVEGFYAQDLDNRLRYRAWKLIYPGHEPEMYSSCEDAEMAAEYLNEEAASARDMAVLLACPGVQLCDAMGVT